VPGTWKDQKIGQQEEEKKPEESPGKLVLEVNRKEKKDKAAKGVESGEQKHNPEQDKFRKHF
jgi:hypothetical protein